MLAKTSRLDILSLAVLSLLLSGCNTNIDNDFDLSCPYSIRVDEIAPITLQLDGRDVQYFAEDYILYTEVSRTYGSADGEIVSNSNGTSYQFFPSSHGYQYIEIFLSLNRGEVSEKDSCNIRVVGRDALLVSLDYDGNSSFSADVSGGLAPYSLEFLEHQPSGIVPLGAQFLEEKGLAILDFKPGDQTEAVEVIVTDSAGNTESDIGHFEIAVEEEEEFRINVEYGTMFCREDGGQIVLRYNSEDAIYEVANQYVAMIDQHAYLCGGDPGFPYSLFCIGPSRNGGSIQAIELIDGESQTLVHLREQEMVSCVSAPSVQAESDEDEDDPESCTQVYNVEKHEYECK